MLELIPRDITIQMSSIDQVWESDWCLFTKIWKGTIDLLVKGTAHTRMNVIGGKITIKTSATSDVGRLTKSLKKMKMNNLTVRRFLTAGVALHVRLRRRYRWIEKRSKRIAMCLERLRTRVLESLEGFPMYAHYGRVGAIPT